ncbi:MAG: alpha/beta hydrolase, partial [Mesorhizobium sp.]
MPEEIDHSRRRLFGIAAATFAAAQLGAIGGVSAQGDQTDATASGTTQPRTAFASLKQIDAGLLNVGYAEDGPADGPPVILLHGWPYDIYSYVDVAPLLADAGYRVIIPYLRGYGTT